jgi:ABC-type multidrug transport system fused ATPase/permease subunit
MLWTERFFQLIPIGKESGSFASFLKVRLIRSLCLTFIFILIGVPFFWGAGIMSASYSVGFALVFVLFLVAVIFLVFVVSGWFHNKWDWFFDWSSHILELSETEFGKFRDRREKLINSFYACLAIAVFFVVFGMIPSMHIVMEELAPYMFRPMVMGVYLIFTSSLFVLLLGTLIWIIVSMWITFYVTLRQPLNLRLSPHIDEEFRPLAIWGLKVLFIAFVLVAVLAVFYSSGILVSPSGVAGFLELSTFIVILGVIAFLLPFYHVHRVLMKLKKQELHEIEKEHDRLIQDLTDTRSTQTPDTEAHMMYLMDSIINLEVLHIRERRAKDADDWPINTTILSAMAGLVLIPIVVNIITNFI